MWTYARRQHHPIGIDIGHNSVKMLQLESGDGLRVRAAVARPLPPALHEDGPARWSAAAQIILQSLQQGAFFGRRAAVALPPEILHLRPVRLPDLPAGRRRPALLAEQSAAFDFDTSDARVFFLPAGRVRHASEVLHEIILLAARNEDVNKFLQCLHEAGLIVDCLEPQANALIRALPADPSAESDTPRVIVDFGATRSSVIVVRGNEISFIKSINQGGDHFHEAVSRKVGITPEDARQLRRRLSAAAASQSARREAVAHAVFAATRSQFETLADEISLCLRYHAVTFRGRGPAEVLVVGGEAADPNLRSELERALGLPIKQADPFAGMTTDELAPVENGDMRGEWAVAAGLALNGFARVPAMATAQEAVHG